MLSKMDVWTVLSKADVWTMLSKADVWTVLSKADVWDVLRKVWICMQSLIDFGDRLTTYLQLSLD